MANATRARSRNGGAPEREPATVATVEPASELATVEPASEPATVPALNLDLLIESEDIGKARKVYREMTPRAQLDDGRFTCVSRELRADGSLGEFLLTVIRVNEQEPRDSTRRESAQYVSAGTMRKCKTALASINVQLWRD